MRWILLLILVSSINYCYAQEIIQVGERSIRHYNLDASVDGIDFIKVGEDISHKKPILLFLQGSQPVPLIIDYGDGEVLSSFPFDVSPILEDYHLIVISKPHVPLMINVDDLKGGSMYVDPDRLYNKANHLDTYISRSNSVINYLAKQPWVDTDKLVVMGHSEGATVAAKLHTNPAVTHIALGASNPLGRVYQKIQEVRAKEDAGLLTSVEAQERIDELHSRWDYIADNRDDDSAKGGDTFKATYSFSEYLVDDILEMSQPLLIIYGTKDIAARSCDYLPIALAGSDKSNYKVIPYAGRGHNFESFDESGQPNYDDMAWDDVIQQVLDWAK